MAFYGNAAGISCTCRPLGKLLALHRLEMMRGIFSPQIPALPNGKAAGPVTCERTSHATQRSLAFAPCYDS